MKKIISSVTTFILLGAIAYRLFSINSDQSRFVGKRLDDAFNIDTPKVVVFWNIHCAPCKIELGRIRDSINEGEIKPENILAIHIGTVSMDEFNKFYKESAYPFKVILDPNVYETYFQINSTPTTLFINDKRIVEKALVGISPMLIYKIKNFYD